MPLLIATSNRGKLREFQEILGAQFADLLIPADAGLQLDVAETGSSYAENAALKAQAYCQASGLACIADDSGLEVDALDGAPGLYSARFGAGQVSGDGGRRAYLLEKLAGCPQPQGAPGWPAHFHCTVAVAVPGLALRTFDGRCAGYILREERGQNGFGYDPLFFMAEYGKTMAELPEEVKNQISHRARALQAALPLLLELNQG
jgi:XTP/dITP diphosphohydrolase